MLNHIPYRFVIDALSACPVCQKARRGLSEMDALQPLVKNLRPSHSRSRVGVDTFYCSPVGVHTSSGVEGTNSLVLAHLRCICHDKYFRDRWGSPEVIGLVQFIINDSVCGETGIRCFDNMFGSEQGTYFKLPPALREGEKSQAYLRLLNDAGAITSSTS